jgi:hypothetical protein
MSRPRALAYATAWGGLLALGCGRGVDPFAGEWVSVDANGPSMTYLFPGGDTALWIVETEAGPDSIRVPWAADLAPVPGHLDMGPWSEGPLEGRTLYGIVEFHGPDRFRVDFEPGNAEGGGDVRPTAFTDQTVSFVRKRSGPA